jgi:predicted 3-demethylubiquinone-9 3-methyltransferase (glyoxalase superfamily)
MQKISPFLWFDGRAEEAMNFYLGVFPGSKVKNVVRYGDAGPGPKGSVMVANFELEGQEFTALNGGPIYTFSPAISFFVAGASRRSTTTGKSFRQAAERCNAAGFRTSSVFHGRSFPPSCRRCSATRTPRGRAASCARCCR